jgi:uncharacterized protein
MRLYSGAEITVLIEDVFVETAELSLGALIAIGLVLTALGIGIGIAVGRNTSPGSQRHRDSERKLDQVLQDKKTYEDEVVEHFSDTARMLNNLTESYRELHNQLANGAAKLCDEKGPVSLGRLENASEIPAQLASVQQPLDYAPKTSPDEKGMLNEEFGLDRNQLAAKKASESND